MKLKILSESLFIGLISFAGYYKYQTINEGNELYAVINHNVEALSYDESDTSRYPKREGKAQFCTLYIYKKGGVTISVSKDPNPVFEANGEYTKEVKRGLEDRCPDKGAGCNPYSCQEVPY